MKRILYELKNAKNQFARRQPYLPFFIFAFPLFLFSLYVFLSEGVVDYEVYGHYFSAKYLFETPLVFVHWYPKPLFTGLNALFLMVSPLEIKSLQLFDCVVSSLICLTTYKISLRIFKEKKYSILTTILLLTNLLFFAYAYSGLLEPFFALLLTSAIYFYYKRQLGKAMLLISLSTMVRLEGFILIPFWIIFATKNCKNLKERIRIVIIFLGPVFWLLMSLYITNNPLWPLSAYLEENVPNPPLFLNTSLFLQYPPRLLIHMNVLFLTFFLIGSILSVKAKENFFILLHILIILIFTIIPFLFMFSNHSNVIPLSMRLFVDVIPLSAIVATYGVRSVSRNVFHTSEKSRGFRSLNVVRKKEKTFLALIMIFSVFVPIVISNGTIGMFPPVYNARESLEKEVGEWLSQSFSFEAGKFYCSNPAIIYHWHVNYFEVIPISNLKIQEPDNGSIIIWDSIYALSEEMPYSTSRSGYRLLKSFQSTTYSESRFDPLNPTEMSFFVNVFQRDVRLTNDLEISRSSVSLNNTSPKISENVLINAKIYNIQNSSNGEFNVIFCIDEIKVENLIKFQRVFLDGRPTLNVQACWNVNLTGAHNIYILVDIDDEILEYDELNNFVTIPITISE